MAFKVPCLPKIPSTISVNKSETKYCGMPTTTYGSIDVLNLVGQGSYGTVKLCKKNGRLLIMKEMLNTSAIADDDLFLKEMKMMLSIDHNNIVKFDSVITSGPPGISAFLMEYVFFDLEFFGQSRKVSSLKDLLGVMDSFNCSDFEHLHRFIAQDIAGGLTYLHENNVVHRDLKPENVLVSNQHYRSHIELAKHWNSCPVVAKLTDFGESRSELIQTVSLVHTRTENLYRGTPVFMAPEIHSHSGKAASLSDLKSMDIWSLGMTLFVLVNPDLKYPYQIELSRDKVTGQSNLELLKNIYTKKQQPEFSRKYETHRDIHWTKITNAVKLCAAYGSRPSAKEIFHSIIGKPPTSLKRYLL